jgi:hypothetical protein
VEPDSKQSYISVMGVYDCKSSATRLRHELNHVGRRFSEAVRFDLRLWRSDVLSLADFRYELDADMLKTCLFVVAFSGAGTQVLSPCLVGLIGKWSRNCKHKHAALMANPEQSASCEQTLSALKSVALINNISYLCTRSALSQSSTAR